jgi:DNA-binding HxlR family transcriptional regulator
MSVPRPGRPVRGSRTGRPIMALLDLLGRRMSLRILWELSQAAGPLTFRALQEAAQTNPGVLNTRLRELRAAGIVVRDAAGYALGADGWALVRLILPLHTWAEEWGAALRAPARRVRRR